MFDVTYEDYLAHYGTLTFSGRYEWGSGEHPYQRLGFSYDDFKSLKDQGLTEKQISEHFNMSMQELRDNKSLAIAFERESNVRKATELFESGKTNTQIAKEMGVNESTVRGWLDNKAARDHSTAIFKTAEIIGEQVDKKKVIDIGAGVEKSLGVSPTRFKSAIRLLELGGYETKTLYLSQVNDKEKQTTWKVLMKPGTTEAEAIAMLQDANIGTVFDIHSEDNGLTFYAIEKPKSIDSKRVGVAYDIEKDGLIEVRRGVEDVSLGKNTYCQVRIAVDDTHYIKGMAVYSDNLPDGVDILVNSNKKPGTPLIGETKDNSCLKPMKTKDDGSIDWDNPFGAAIKMKDGVTVGQRHYKDENGKEQLSTINIINEEGDWAGWKKTLSSQMLSKQSIGLIKEQLDISKQSAIDEFNEINAVSNPTVRKKLLYSFADQCDSLSEDLSAAALPRQSSHVIIPVKSLKDNEIYAPNYKDGEKVVLIRYPHGGLFEIPELVVNNRNKEARGMIGETAVDAVGITQATAKKLSGADFDGDTVIVIPNTGNKIKTQKAQKELMDFDPEIYYDPKLPKMKDATKAQEMGKATNLIADMTLKEAPLEDVIPAVKYSMVVIDAQKHSYDYKQAYEDFGIAKLNEKYRGRSNAGASTIVTRAKSVDYIPQRKQARSNKELGIVNGIDIKTGEKVYIETGKTRYTPKTDKEGNVIGWTETLKTDKVTKMSLAKDAFELVGNPENPKEIAYADYANTLKSLALEARRTAVNTANLKRDPSAVKVYEKEVESLKEKLDKVAFNKPKERQAQALANKRLKAAIRDSSQEMTRDRKKRIANELLAGARLSLGAKKPKIEITDREWLAIDSGAVSSNILSQIIANVSLDSIRNQYMPRETQRSRLSYSEEALIRSMAARPGVTQAEIADAMGFSVSTINAVLNA